MLKKYKGKKILPQNKITINQFLMESKSLHYPQNLKPPLNANIKRMGPVTFRAQAFHLTVFVLRSVA